MHTYYAHGLPYFINSSGVMQFREACYTAVSYAPYILLQIYTITILATFRVTILNFSLGPSLLCILMNRSFDEGIFPDICIRKIAYVIPIFEKGHKSQPSNYLPVALLSCIGKLQERIILKHV